MATLKEDMSRALRTGDELCQQCAAILEKYPEEWSNPTLIAAMRAYIASWDQGRLKILARIEENR